MLLCAFPWTCTIACTCTCMVPHLPHPFLPMCVHIQHAHICIIIIIHVGVKRQGKGVNVPKIHSSPQNQRHLIAFHTIQSRTVWTKQIPKICIILSPTEWQNCEKNVKSLQNHGKPPLSQLSHTPYLVWYFSISLVSMLWASPALWPYFEQLSQLLLWRDQLLLQTVWYPKFRKPFVDLVGNSNSVLNVRTKLIFYNFDIEEHFHLICSEAQSVDYT